MESIIEGIERMRRKPDASIGVDAASFLHQHGLLSKPEYRFLLSMDKKTTALTNRQRIKLVTINMRLLCDMGIVPYALETIVHGHK